MFHLFPFGVFWEGIFFDDYEKFIQFFIFNEKFKL